MILSMFLLLGLGVIMFWFFYSKKSSLVQIQEMNCGKFKIVALLDGFVQVLVDDIVVENKNIDHSYWHTLLSQHSIELPLTVYLIDTGYKIILVDVGLAGLQNSKTGYLMKGLEQAGYQVDQITDILISHLHLHNVAGLLNPDGKKAFPHAQLHISKEDIAYWIYDQQVDPEVRALMTKLIISYALHGFSSDQKLFDGVCVVSTPGHSPGHASFLFESEGQSLLIWGDLVHIPELQFTYPEISLKIDKDQSLAIQTRKKLLERVSQQRMLIGGSYLPFPGFGYVNKAEDGVGYVFSSLQNKINTF